MRTVLASLILAMVVTGLVVTVAGTAMADDSSFTSTAGLGALSGEQIYAHICQGCHMAQGRGAVGAGYYPKLAGDTALASWQYVAITVLNGKNGMPAFGLPADQVLETRTVHLSNVQIADVANYVRNAFGNHYRDKATAAGVAALPHPSSDGPEP